MDEEDTSRRLLKEEEAESQQQETLNKNITNLQETQERFVSKVREGLKLTDGVAWKRDCSLRLLDAILDLFRRSDLTEEDYNKKLTAMMRNYKPSQKRPGLESPQKETAKKKKQDDNTTISGGIERL